MPRILVIDDNPGVHDALEILFSLHDIDTRVAFDAEEGLAMLAAELFDLVIQDMNFSADTTSGEEGVALFHEIRRRHPHMPVILLTAWTQLETAVELVRAGAADYLAKPWDDDKLVTSARNLLELGRLSRESSTLRRQRHSRREALARDHDL